MLTETKTTFELIVLILLCLSSGLGLYLAFNGFSKWRRKRFLENIPTSKINSAAMGLVEIHGSVKDYHTLKLQNNRNFVDSEWYQITDRKIAFFHSLSIANKASYLIIIFIVVFIVVFFVAVFIFRILGMNEKNTLITAMIIACILAIFAFLRTLLDYLWKHRLNKESQQDNSGDYSFCIQDDSGEVRVNLNGARVKLSYSGLFLRLMPGDKIYIIGTFAKKDGYYIMRKGQKEAGEEDIFIISDKSEKNVGHLLFKQALTGIIFGGAFAFVSLFILLTYYGKYNLLGTPFVFGYIFVLVLIGLVANRFKKQLRDWKY